MKTNNRVIKFRAWTGIQMEYKVMAGHLGAFYVQGMNEVDSDCMSTFNTIYPKETPIMQYTGLLDKNGKEIYEGDIIEVAGNKKYEVRYCEGGESAFEWYGGMFILWLNQDTFFPFDAYAIKTGKVIGNIYEHPELLTNSNTNQ